MLRWVIGGVPIIIVVHVLPIELPVVRWQRLVVIMGPIIRLMVPVLHVIATIHCYFPVPFSTRRQFGTENSREDKEEASSYTKNISIVEDRTTFRAKIQQTTRLITERCETLDAKSE